MTQPQERRECPCGADCTALQKGKARGPEEEGDGRSIL